MSCTGMNGNQLIYLDALGGVRKTSMTGRNVERHTENDHGCQKHTEKTKDKK